MKAHFARPPDVRGARSLYEFMPKGWTVFPSWLDVSTVALRDPLDLGHRESTDDLADSGMYA